MNVWARPSKCLTLAPMLIAVRPICLAANGNVWPSGRAIVREPKLFLFDEPLSNLDAALRMNTRIEIAEASPHPQRLDDLCDP